jgi:16S rRNA G1207 methylase RsmC
LGVDCPIAEIAAAAREVDATAIVIDLPRTSPQIRGRLRRLRERIGRSTVLVVSGDAALGASGFLVLRGTAGLHEWAVGAA